MNPVSEAKSGGKSGRKSIRLKGYNYSGSGGYFVTIATQLREPFFGKVCDTEKLLSEAGQMVMQEWEALPKRFPTIEMDVFQVMPNHLHAIPFIHNPNPVEAGLARIHAAGFGVPAHDTRDVMNSRVTTRVAPTLGEIIGAYKPITTDKYIRGAQESAWPGFSRRLWQRDDYEHILRNQVDYARITGYIGDNPLNWEQDEENPRVNSRPGVAFP
jgi:putative transposase